MNVWTLLEHYAQQELTPTQVAYDLGLFRYETIRRYYKEESYPSLCLCRKLAKAYNFDFVKFYTEISELKAKTKNRSLIIN